MQTNIRQSSTLGGRYRLLRRIGAGGMGAVWEAEDAVLDRHVAVKILSPSLCDDERVAARFRREAQAAGRLAHPNIAQVFDYGEDDGCPYIVLELVPGSTLRQTLEARGRVAADEVAAIGAQIADALAAAHDEGIVHRDVKPGNVMVAPDGRVKVMDFGIAEAVWLEPITDTGTVMATARYISPEQATGGGATSASDVYSTGVVLYELLAGRPPFVGDSPFAVAHAHAHETPPPLDELLPDVPSSVRASVEAAMRKDPRERPSASELAAALRRAPGDDATAILPAVPAGRTTPSTRADGPSRRAIAWALAGIVVVLVLTLAWAALAGTPNPSGGHPRRHAATPPSAAVQTARPAGDASSGATNGERHDGEALGHDEGHGRGNGEAPGHED